MKKQIKHAEQNSSVDTALLREIRELILSVRKTVVRNVNSVQVITSFEIGRRIVEHQQKGAKRAEYGRQILKELAEQLSNEFGPGFSERNLRNMRKFYLVYQERFKQIRQTASAKFNGEHISEILQIPSAKSELCPKSRTESGKSIKALFSLSWSQYVFLVGIKDDDARSFYEIEAANNSWTLPELTRQFNSGLYERLALSRDKAGVRKLAKEGQVISKQEDLLDIFPK